MLDILHLMRSVKEIMRLAIKKLTNTIIEQKKRHYAFS